MTPHNLEEKEIEEHEKSLFNVLDDLNTPKADENIQLLKDDTENNLSIRQLSD